jgi:O-antigen ligase
MAFISVFAASPRLRALTIGGGQHQASTDSRLEMWTGGFPKILERPLFGHGSGLGAETLGFTNLAGVLTIDTYWLSALLEFGVVGAGALLGMIVWVFVAGAKAYSAPAHGISRLGGPIAVSLLTFFIVKSVLSQADNHLLVFVMMAMMLIVARGAAAFDETAEDLTTARPSGPTRGAQLRRPVVATQPSRVAATGQDGRGRRFPVDPPRPSRSLRTGTR